MEKEIFYIQDVTKIFGVTRDTIYRWCRSGNLKYSELPTGRRFFTREQIEAFKNGSKVK